jgi:co-chaperonin GroES (HSP10)
MNALHKFAGILALTCALSGMAQQPAATRALGAVSRIHGNVITMKTDAGAEISVTVADTARVVRLEPGQTDLKAAAPVPLAEIQAGDRILARGAASPDGKSIDATTVVVMKHADVAAKQEKEREDWQRRGVGGLVKSVDPAAGTIALVTTGFTAETLTVQTAKDTIVRQYAPDSVKFDDAKLSAIAEIKPGDQLRARGNRAAGSSTVTAEEIVFGTFRNVAGTVLSTDAANQTLTVMDLATKKPVVVKVTAESQMHKLPAMIAQMIAMRMRGALGGENAAPQRAQGPPQGQRGGGFGGGRNADMSQMLARMPQLTLADLQKGDALMIVTTDGNGAAVSAVTLLAGVEPILSAPNPLSASTILSPWNIGTGGAGETQ